MFKLLKKILLFCIYLHIASCSSVYQGTPGQIEENSITPNKYVEGKTTKGYTVRGTKYYPLLSAEGFYEVGIASWYGPGFHGKKTANGEIFNQNALTAAHKFLPLGTYVFVENLQNGRRIRVKINDRGPFAHDRVIDLSKKAASDLDLIEKGLGQVRITYDENARRNTSNNSINTHNPNTLHASERSSSIGTGEITTTSAISSTSASGSSSVAQALAEISSGHSNSSVNSTNPNNSTNSNISDTVNIGGNTYIELQTYSTQNEAQKNAEIVSDLGLPHRIVKSGSSFTLQAGPYKSTSAAENYLAVLQIKFPKAKIVK